MHGLREGCSDTSDPCRHRDRALEVGVRKQKDNSAIIFASVYLTYTSDDLVWAAFCDLAQVCPELLTRHVGVRV